MEAEVESRQKDGGGTEESKEAEETQAEAETEEGEEAEEGISRPSTPSMPIFDILPKNEDEWWRPSHPPETYMWEEVRRKRQKGGYPWTLLDKDDEIDVEDYLDDNLYEPVNPPPLYGTGSSYMAGASKDQHETGSLDGRTMIDIPPEIEIVNSEGLDGLDQPDLHDRGIDGDKEWMHSDDEHGPPPKVLFTAGIRNREAAKVPDAQTSSIRPLTNKNLSFSQDAPSAIESEPVEEDEELQEVPSETPQPQPGPSPARKTTTAFEILKSKAAGAADQVKQRINKISLPVRPKLNQWEGVKLARKKPKKKSKVQEPELEPEQEVPEEEMAQEAMGEIVEPQEPTQDIEAAKIEEEQKEVEQEEEIPEAPAMSAKEAKAEALRKEKEAAAEEKLRKQKEQEETKRQKAEEKQRKQKEQEELKRQKAEEEQKAKKEQEELKRQKAEEEQKAKKEQEELKRQKAEEEQKAKKEQEELKRQKAEEEQKAKKEQEELKRQKAEEEQKAKEELQKKKAEEKLAAKQKAAEEAKKAAEEAKRLKLEEQLAKAREAEERRRIMAEEELQKIREIEEAKTEEAEVAVSVAVTSTEEEEIVQDSQPQEEEIQEAPQVATPTGTTKRKVKKMTFPQLPQLPHLPSLPKIDLDFKRKVIKRSKTPPARPQPPRTKFPKTGVEETENQLAAQYTEELEARKVEMEEEEQPESATSPGLREPQIFVTQPSSEPSEDTATHVNWEPPQPSTSANNEEVEEEIEEPSPATRKQPATKERLDKIGKQLKGFGAKSKEAASQKSKAMGEKMKVIGKDLQKFGVKVNERYQATVEEIKAKQEAAKVRTKQKAKEAEDIDDNIPMEVDVDYPESATEPRRKFRFRRRDESQEEQEDAEPKDSAFYENADEMRTQTEQEGKTDEGRITRSQLLGRADRDWESPLDLAQSRDMSEDRYSANASSRDSPPGSSMASSTFAHVRKQGVLEEIDSDEFFLREKGISEGEDEDEINRFLVEELRQAFRPQMANALAGFDLPSPPQRPERLPRKPPRKDKGDQSPNYQTFPPERPRRKAPGYVSAYMNDHPDDMEEDQGSNEEERGSPPEQGEEYDEDGMQRVKEELQRIELEEAEQQGDDREEYEDDGRYEPINEEPVKPQRTKRRQQKSSTPLYYNTVAGNEWMRDLEEQVQTEESPKAPQRERRKSSQSRSIAAEVEETEKRTADATARGESEFSPEGPEPQSLTQAESEVRVDDAEVDIDDSLEYVDEAGYAVVHKEREPPRTTPRRKKRSSGSSKGSSLKRSSPEQQQQANENDPAFFSLPRYTPRTFHIVPPSRPQRNYSTLKPRRPPRNKSNQNVSKSKGDKDEGSRPSTAIGIMQNRPLPPPPRPERSPAPLNDLDQTSIERAVGARHYANFDDREGVVEELFTATNIPVLGRTSGEQQSSSTVTAGDTNTGIQTDPFQDAQLDIEAAIRSYEEESSRVEKQSDSLRTSTSYDRDTRRQERSRSPAPPRETQPQPQSSSGQQPQFVFPRRLHLEELEVDVLRVNDLSAHSINVQNLQAPQLEVNSLTSVGPLSVSSIHTQTLNSDQINCNRLSTDTADLPSVIPQSFFKLSSPDDEPVQQKPTEPSKPAPPPVESAEELRLETGEQEDAENESAYPYRQDSSESLEHHYEVIHHADTDPSDYQKEGCSPTNEFNISVSDAGYCLTPEEPLETEDNWERYALSEEYSKASEQYDDNEPYNEYIPSEPCDDFAKYSESQIESSMPSEDFLKSNEEHSECCLPGDNYAAEPELSDINLGQPDSEQPETDIQESEQPETDIQESEQPETDIQESEQPETDIQESEQPEYIPIQESQQPETTTHQKSEQLEAVPIQEAEQSESDLFQEPERLEPVFIQEEQRKIDFTQESAQPQTDLIEESQQSDEDLKEIKQISSPEEEIIKSFEEELMSDEAPYDQDDQCCPPENEEEPKYEAQVPLEPQDEIESSKLPEVLASNLDGEMQDQSVKVIYSSEPEPEQHYVLTDESTAIPQEGNEKIDTELSQIAASAGPSSVSKDPTETEDNLEKISSSNNEQTSEKSEDLPAPKEPGLVSAPPTVEPVPVQRDIQPSLGTQQGQDEDVIQLSIRLGRALTRLTMRGLQAMIDFVDTATTDNPLKAEEQRANMQVLLCVILILIAGMLLSSQSPDSSHPKWEFLMPPPDL